MNRDLFATAAPALHGPDAEHADILAALSISGDGPTTVARRRFLQGMLVAGGATALTVGPLGRAARAITGVTDTEGILVVVQMGGGNDGLNTVIPYADSRYRSLRPDVAVPANQVLKLGTNTGLGLHPSLARLKARYDSGKVAIVRGVGQTDSGDHSHFSSTAAWMAGTATASRSTGWLGRYVDLLADGDDGFRAISVGTSVPLHLVGTRAQVTSLPVWGAPFGGNRADAAEAKLFDAVAAYGAGTTGRGKWADLLAAADKAAVERAGAVSPLYPDGYSLPAGDLTPQLDLAARLINLDVGARVITVSFGSFDTHDDEAGAHADLLADLDAGIARFFSVLKAKWADQVTLMTFSEFGRRAEQNDSRGTDHGTASVAFVVGDQVKGGLHGTQPSLADLDTRGDLKVKVDYRSVYASVLKGWFSADAAAILGGSYPDLGLFRATPGVKPPPPPPPPDARWLPFTSVTALVQQQYLDFLGRPADAGGTTYWTGRLTSKATSISGCIKSFVDSNEFGRVVRPAARIALAGEGIPGYFDLIAWAKFVKAGQPREVAAQVVTRHMFVVTYGSLAPAQLVPKLATDVLGSVPGGSWQSTWVTALTKGTKTKADLLYEVAESPANQVRSQAAVDVLMVYVGMLRRVPDRSGFEFWTGKAKAGGLSTLIANFFNSTEYARRFT